MKRAALLAGAALVACGAVSAHPHGSIDCRAEVRLEEGALQSLRGELLLDPLHSQQALQLVREAPQLAPDPVRLQRLAFALSLQLARSNWLFALEADGQPVALVAGGPRLAFTGDRLQVSVELRPAADAPAATQWRLRCADPSWYWTTSMLQPLEVQGCATRQDLQFAGDGAAAAVQWRCGAAGLSP